MKYTSPNIIERELDLCQQLPRATDRESWLFIWSFSAYSIDLRMDMKQWRSDRERINEFEAYLQTMTYDLIYWRSPPAVHEALTRFLPPPPLYHLQFRHNISYTTLCFIAASFKLQTTTADNEHTAANLRIEHWILSYILYLLFEMMFTEWQSRRKVVFIIVCWSCRTSAPKYQNGENWCNRYQKSAGHIRRLRTSWLTAISEMTQRRMCSELKLSSDADEAWQSVGYLALVRSFQASSVYLPTQAASLRLIFLRPTVAGRCFRLHATGQHQWQCERVVQRVHFRRDWNTELGTEADSKAGLHAPSFHRHFHTTSSHTQFRHFCAPVFCKQSVVSCTSSWQSNMLN